MKALCWYGRHDVRVEKVPDPSILNPRDAIVRVTSTAICGSDLHLYGGFQPGMAPGDILGHEFMGEVVETGPAVRNLRRGDRVVVPFTISCGACHPCSKGEFSLCDNSNPNADAVEKLFGYGGAGLFGYSHLYGGYAGGQAEYVRVPFADVGPFKVPGHLSDEQVLFLTDILPTGYMAAENCGIKPGEVVAVWGCGPVGLLAVKCAYLLGAGRVIAIDRVEERLRLAREECNAETINFLESDVYDTLREMTGGRGPSACIDAVGLEAHGTGSVGAVYDKAKGMMMLATDRLTALRQALVSCGKGGTVSIPGVYGGLLDKVPLGAAFAKGLTLRMGQTHVHRYLPLLLEHIDQGRIDPTFVISHRLPLDDAPRGYATFLEKAEGCTKIVMNPTVH
jgi:threonine dehydrogenase-like Zn-dependent dehydrogenase